MSVSFWLVIPVGSLEQMSAFRKFVAIRKFGVTDRLGSGGDCDLVKNITNLNDRY
jgi:hypothetical protein